MKAITIWQPWASLVACGAKRYETRGWATNYRGLIAIHAALRHPNWWHRDTYDTPELETAIVHLWGAWGWHSYDDLPRGAIIATAELIYCHKIHRRFSDGHPCLHITTLEADMAEISITGNELLFGDWTPGRYAWELANVKMLPEPIPAKGRQGLWNWEG